MERTESQSAAEPVESAEQVETTESRFDQLLANLTDKQVLRVHIFDGMGSPEYAGRVLVENMKMVEDFIWDGTVPPDPDAHKNSRLKVVPK